MTVQKRVDNKKITKIQHRPWTAHGQTFFLFYVCLVFIVFFTDFVYDCVAGLNDQFSGFLLCYLNL